MTERQRSDVERDKLIADGRKLRINEVIKKNEN